MARPGGARSAGPRTVRGVRLPLLLLPVLLLAGCTAGAEPDPGPGSAAPLACAQDVEVRAGLVVPSPPQDLVGALVPSAVPTAALLCRYDAQGALTASVALAPDSLAPLPEDLLLPRAFAGTARPCPEPGDPVLLRLRTPDGDVDLASADGEARCAGTTNGRFASPVTLGDAFAASGDAGRWGVPTAADPELRCGPGRPGRAGQEAALAPGEPTGVVLCTVDGRGVTRTTGSDADLAVVLEVLADPVARPSTGGCSDAATGGELLLTYAAGPPVLVVLRPGCDPTVDNGSLSAVLEDAATARLSALLPA